MLGLLAMAGNVTNQQTYPMTVGMTYCKGISSGLLIS
tara:strand:+ start:1808 stop:1918 length:111 start_codon:yes stop_codon:yes gene_type:complete